MSLEEGPPSPWSSVRLQGAPHVGWPLSVTLGDLSRDTLLPTGLGSDPRQWSKHNVSMWLEWCTEQFSLVPTDAESFHMNGKALCLLSKGDFLDRAPKAGDVLFNALQLLLHGALQNARLTNGAQGFGNGTVPRSTVITRDVQGFGQVLFQDSYQQPLQVSPLSAEVDSTVILSPDPSSGGESVQGDAAPPGSRRCSPPPSVPPGDATRTGRSADEGTARGRASPAHERTTTSVPLDGRGPPPAAAAFGPRSGVSAFPGMVPDVVLSGALPTTVKTALLHNGGGVSGGAPSQGTVVADGPGDKMSVRLLWDFLQQLLNDTEQRYRYCIAWKDQGKGVFKIVDPHRLAKLWGMQKNHLNMNFDKMSRAMRYYYRVKILQKEPGERLCYRFLRPPTELRYCKQRSLLDKGGSGTNADAGRRGTRGATEDDGGGSSALDMSVKEECLSPAAEND